MGRMILFLIATCSAAAAATEGETTLKRQEAMIERIASLLAEGKPGEGLPIAEALIAEGEARAASEQRRVYSGQTVEMVLSNMLAAAADKVSAVDIGPGYGKGLFFKGFTLVELRRSAEAGAFLDRAVAVSPSNSQFLCEDGSWHARYGSDPAGALSLYQRCEAESGTSSEDVRQHWRAVGLRGQGYALIDLDRLDEAAAKYRASLEIEPGNPIALGDLQVIAERKAAQAKHIS